MTAGASTMALSEPPPRDREVQEVVLRLVEAFAFAEAHAVLGARLREIAALRQSHIERLLLEWFDMCPSTRPDFLTYAHHRRDPALAGPDPP